MSMLPPDLTPLDLQALLEGLSEPVFVIDSDFRLQGANKIGYGLLIQKPEQARGQLTGVVFQCANAQLPGGCGKTVNCPACMIRNSVTHTYATGETLRDIAVDLKCGDPADPVSESIRISTEKMGDVVLLRVDKLHMG